MLVAGNAPPLHISFFSIIVLAICRTMWTEFGGFEPRVTEDTCKSAKKALLLAKPSLLGFDSFVQLHHSSEGLFLCI